MSSLLYNLTLYLIAAQGRALGSTMLIPSHKPSAPIKDLVFPHRTFLMQPWSISVSKPPRSDPAHTVLQHPCLSHALSTLMDRTNGQFAANRSILLRFDFMVPAHRPARSHPCDSQAVRFYDLHQWSAWSQPFDSKAVQIKHVIASGAKQSPNYNTDVILERSCWWMAVQIKEITTVECTEDRKFNF